jgi:decaprenylphospho-beta-D-ribofuranose 2-oxidase
MTWGPIGTITDTANTTSGARHELVSFDGTEACRGVLVRPDRYGDLRAALRGPGPFVARGAGLSYCQASAGDGVTTVSTRSFDRFLAFDPDRRRVTVEPGVTIGELVRFAVGRDAWFPVLPGHPAITVGGCVAFNVHGKSQHDVGCFSDHVVSLTLLHPDHGELTCSRNDNAAVFELTLGGLGLTGHITTVTLQLRALAGRGIRRTAHAVASLAEAVELMRSLAVDGGGGGTLYSWHDLNRRGSGFGRGIVYAETFEDDAPPPRSRYRPLASGHRYGPQIARIRVAARLLNVGYAARERLAGSRVHAVEDAAFPINGNEAYYRLFGRRGFREYQMLLPSGAWAAAAPEVERLVAGANVPVTLGSLKLFRGDRTLLWFRGEGVCLAVDVPAGDASDRLFARLDRLVLDLGGLVNLSKDSRVAGETVRALYPGYDEFRRRLDEHDPRRRFDSMLRRRIHV